MSSQYKINFHEKRCIGSGAFSTVFEAISNKDGQSYAIKKIPFRKEDEYKTLKEIEILLTLKSDFIVTFIDSWIEENYYIGSFDPENATKDLSSGNLLYSHQKPLLLHIQMELCSTTLSQYIEQLMTTTYQNKMTKECYSNACEILFQLLECVHYLHAHNPQIIHRDLKPDNVLLIQQKDGTRVKLTDFGLSTYHEFVYQSHTKYVGTKTYRAPEVARKQYSVKVDIYSLGIIMEQLFNFDYNSEETVFDSEIQVKYENAKQICLKCVSHIPKQRPECKQILNDQVLWFYVNNSLQDLTKNIRFEKFIEHKWPLMSTVKNDFLINCKKILVYEEMEEKAVFITKDKTFYALRTSEHIDSAAQEPCIITEFVNQEIQSISCGKCFVLCLTKNKLIYTFGDNYSGQLGIGTYTSCNKPTLIKDLIEKDIIEIKCGAYHSLALSETGIVYAWGHGKFGQIANGLNYNKSKPIKVNFLTSDEIISIISCGYHHCLALCKSGKLYGWGLNDCGQLGIGNHTNQNKAILVSFDEEIIIKQINCGQYHSLVLTADGVVYSFGDNSYGQLGIGCTDTQIKPTKIQTNIKFTHIETTFCRNTSFGLSFDNKYYVWGDFDNKSITAPRNEINLSLLEESLNYNSRENSIVKRNEEILTQSNVIKYLNPELIANIISTNNIKLKELKAIFLAKDDNVFAMRLSDSIDFSFKEPVIVKELSNKKIRSIVCGFNHVLCLTKDNKVFSFGDNTYGQLGNGSLNNNYKPTIISELSDKRIIEISCGKNHCLALSEFGNIYVWGYGYYGQIGCNETKLHQNSPLELTILLCSDKIVDVSCGGYHCLVLTSYGDVYSWGSNEFGQCGVETEPFSPPIRSTPTIINSDSIRIIKITCACSHSLMLSNDHNIYSFGRNNYGQLGIGNTEDQNQITKIETSIKFADIYTTCFEDISAALSQTGNYYIWGKCGADVFTTPKQSQLTSFDEIFAKYSKYKFTAKHVLLKKFY